MDSFKRATADAAHAVLFEKVDDLKFDTSSVEARVARLENDLRKRLRNMRKRNSASRNAICMEKKATRRYISDLRATHSRDMVQLRVLEARLADVLKSYPIRTLTYSDLAEIRRPSKRVRRMPPMPDVFQMDEVACMVMPFLTARDAFRGLACASKAHRRITRRWFPRLISKGATLPPYHWDVSDLKGLTTIRASHVRDVDQLSRRLVDLHSTRFPLGFTLSQVCGMDWPRLEVLSLPGILPHAFWVNYCPVKMPRLRRITLAWGRHGIGAQLDAWMRIVRDWVRVGSLRLDAFPSDLTFSGQEVTAFDDYLEIHKRIGTTSFTIDANTDTQRFHGVLGNVVESLVVNAKIAPVMPSLAWTLTRLTRLQTLVVEGLGSFVPGDFEACVNQTVTSLTVRLSGAETCVRGLLQCLGGLRHLTLDVWNVRSIVSRWMSDSPAWLGTLETLQLRSAGRFIYTIPYNGLPSLHTVTVQNLTDTQTYCLLGDVGRMGPRLTFRMPFFVSNKVGSMLRAYEADDRCRANIQIKGYQSAFFVTIGGETMRKVTILEE